MSKPQVQDKIVPGAVIEIGYPFVRADWPGEDGPEPSWRPGTRQVDTRHGDTRLEADAMGTMIVTVISLHKPGHFETRVFFTRRWRDPDGREFGRREVRSMAQRWFRRYLAGYRHRFDLVENGAPAAPRQLEPDKSKEAGIGV